MTLYPSPLGNNLLLGENVTIGADVTFGANVVVHADTVIGAGCYIDRAVIDEGCEIPDGMRIGVDRGQDAARFHVTDHGVVLVTPEMLPEAP